MQFLKKNKVFFLFRANLSHFARNLLKLDEKFIVNIYKYQNIN